MAFDRRAIKNDALFVTINGQKKSMKVANMTDQQIKTALGRPDNAGALSSGWVRDPNGTIRFAGQPAPSQGGGGNTSVAQQTADANRQDQGAAQAAQNAQQPIAPITTPVIVPENPAVTGPGQAQVAAAQQAAKVGVAGINASIADLTGNNYAKYNTRLNTVNRDATIGRHDYNAQSNASGFRRSGGVRTNNNAVNAAASQAQGELFNTYGDGAVNNLKLQKQGVIHQKLQDLLGGWMSSIGPINYGDY